MPIPSPPFGIAMSGGGFRATAYHLGVLKRLRELKLLEKIDELSVVSGGSIAGAYWVYWQARRGDTINDAREWDAFEQSLIDLMHRGIRGTILAKSFFLPALVISVLLVGLATRIPTVEADEHLLLLIVAATIAFIAAYFIWISTATYLLQQQFQRQLFRDCKMSDLRWTKNQGRHWPRLSINATAFQTGEHLVFESDVESWSYERRVKAISQVGITPASDVILRVSRGYDEATKYHIQLKKPLKRDRPPIFMKPDTLLASAVTVSSAFPPVFPPLTTASFWKGENAKVNVLGEYITTDGGVFDNQGIQQLLHRSCTSIIVSDACAALKARPSLLTWMLLPTLLRAHDIVYDRCRDLGYKRLADRHELYRLCKETASESENYANLAKKHAPLVAGYAFIELNPVRGFRWTKGLPRLPKKLINLVSTVRTDLDRFSMEEISALMFHGYTVIDHCLRAYRREWVDSEWPVLNFTFQGEGIFKNWSETPSKPNIRSAALHLSLSSYPLYSYRSIARFLSRIWR